MTKKAEIITFGCRLNIYESEILKQGIKEHKIKTHQAILNYKNISEIAVASGVVIDSNAKNEFNENYIKAKSLIDLYQ